jgi:DnaJ-class molecular chaperone
MVNEESITVTIPRGVKTGQKLRIQGKGNQKRTSLFNNEQERGDLYLIIVVQGEEEGYEEIKQERIRKTEARHRYEYKVERIERNLVTDRAVVQNAEDTINRYARDGWRLHSYSQESLIDGVMRGGSNVLHLVFEREREQLL